MKDPTRLLDLVSGLDEGATELELQLLRAGASEQPPPAAMQRLAETLGVSAHHVATTKLPPMAANKLKLVPPGMFATGMLATGFAVASIVWVLARQPAQPPARSADPQALATQPVAPAVRIPQPNSTPTEPAHSLAQEIARIDSIRRLLATDRPKLAISALQDYQRDFPSGLLQQEAEVLTIEAQRQSGNKRQARQLAARFLANHPDSPHSAHVRELLEALRPDAR